MEEGHQKSLLTERRTDVSEAEDLEIGQPLCSRLVRLWQSGRVFARDHQQTIQAAEELAQWLEAYFEGARREEVHLQLTEHNVFLDGALVSIDERGQERVVQLRQSFLKRKVNVLELRRGVTAEDLLAWLDAWLEEPDGESSLNGFATDHLALRMSAQSQEAAEVESDERRDVIALYAGLLIRTRAYFEAVRRRNNPGLRDVKRLIQRIADVVDQRADVFIGLIHMRLMTGEDYVHAAHCGIYAVVLADVVGLKPEDVVRCGLTALAQDVDKLDDDATDLDLAVGDQTHFQTNMASVMTLTQTGTRDVLSALRLVTNYERGFPCNRPLPPAWYDEELSPHLLTRIVEIARDYDMLTQGLGDLEPLTPDMALQALMMKMGSFYDPILVRLFVNAIGIYPAGSVVRLTDGREALVVRSNRTPDHRGVPRSSLPVVRLLGSSEELIDLGDPSNYPLQVERVLNEEERQVRPSALLLF